MDPPTPVTFRCMCFGGAVMAQTTRTGTPTTTPNSSANGLWMNPSLCVEVRAWRRGVEICTTVGDIDLGTAPSLWSALAEWERRASPRLVVDLSRVDFLSVAGARNLATAAEQARIHRRRLSVVVASRPVRRVLQLTGFDRQLVTYRRLPEALAADAASLDYQPAPHSHTQRAGPVPMRSHHGNPRSSPSGWDRTAGPGR